jgi:N-acyl-D-amino-acid deacylase
MTGATATALGIADRGVLDAGNRADVTIFDAGEIAERATYEDPHRYAEGISTVIVNGQPVFENGAHTGALPGHVVGRETAAGTP